MPTAYTAFIEDGRITTAKDFIMLCSREFGAMAPFMGKPLETPIPEQFNPDDCYYVDELKKAREKLKKLMSMTDEEIERENNEWHDRAVKDNRSYQEAQEALRDKYIPILDAVKRWKPPTEEHERLKEFAIEQIVSSMPDTGTKIYSEEKCSNEQWLENSLVRCLKDIQYYEKMVKEEKESCEKRNKWLKELRDSLATMDE